MSEIFVSLKIASKGRKTQKNHELVRQLDWHNSENQYSKKWLEERQHLKMNYAIWKSIGQNFRWRLEQKPQQFSTQEEAFVPQGGKSDT